MSDQSDSFDSDSFSNNPSDSPDLLPGVKSSFMLIVNEYLSQAKYSEALKYLEAIQSPFSQGSFFLMKLGHLSFKLKKFRESETYYFEALNCGNSQYLDEIWFGLGQVYFALNFFKQCISSFNCVLQINPNFPYSSLCYLKLGISSIKLKEFSKSLIYLENSLAKNDLSQELKAKAFCHIGSAKLATGNNENINKYFCKAAEFIRNFHTGICLAWKLLTTDPRKAVIFCDKMMTEFKKIEEVVDFKCFKAVALMKLNKLKKSKQNLQHLIRLYPHNIVFGQYFAILCIKTGSVFEAAQILEYLKMAWPFHLNILLNYFKVMKNLLKSAEAEITRMQIIGILMVHQYTEGEILEFLDESCSELKEPVLVLTDFPSSGCSDYNIIEENKRIT